MAELEERLLRPDPLAEVIAREAVLPIGLARLISGHARGYFVSVLPTQEEIVCLLNTWEDSANQAGAILALIKEKING